MENLMVITTCSDYSEFYQFNSQDIYNFCMSMTGNDKANAQTITDEAFNSLREHWDTFSTDRERNDFLIRVATKNCGDLSEQLRNKAIDAMIGFMSAN